MASTAQLATDRASLSFKPLEQGWRLLVCGRFDLEAVETLQRKLQSMRPLGDGKAKITIDVSELRSLDTAGAVALRQLGKRLSAEGHSIEYQGFAPQLQEMMDEVNRECDKRMPPPRLLEGVAAMVARAGKGFLVSCDEARALLTFLGMCVVYIGRSLIQPRRIRFPALLHHMEVVGVNALPIVGLLSFLIGIVIAYQSAEQLKAFGAELMVVNILGVSVIRELGIMMTAIIVAGRSGSAFTAQIGTMKVNQEVDAMQTMGLDPMEFLVLPRLLALVLIMPLLAFYAALFALFGGALMAYVHLGINFAQFINQLETAITNNSVLVGMIKAPVFAFVIALVGCYQGLRVSGSAESVGQLTTVSVVESIFLIITLDAVFSIFFSIIGL